MAQASLAEVLDEASIQSNGSSFRGGLMFRESGR